MLKAHHAALAIAAILVIGCQPDEQPGDQPADAGAQSAYVEDPPMQALSTFKHEAGPAKGLTVQVLHKGTGEPATAGMTLAMHYTGWFDAGDGKRGDKFDSSRPGGNPYPVEGVGRAPVIDGWNLGLPTVGECEGIRLGEIRRLLIPYPLAYGEEGHLAGIPPRANLVFEVECMKIAAR